MAFELKNRRFSDVMLAPMAGVTDAPFRAMVRKFGGELLFSEMILADSLARAHKRTTEMAMPDETDAPIAIQLEGRNPDTMAAAARIAERHAAFIDLNMGCPVNKIAKAGGGSGLMRDEELAEKIVRAVVDAVKVPVTVKFRLGWDEESKNFADFGKRMEQAGASAVILHARTREQQYGGKADWSAFGELKRAVSVPVVANGDIKTKADADFVKLEYGADAVMIGRQALGRPWVLAEVSGRAVVRPPVVETVLEHLELMQKYYGAKAIFIARKHIAWYSVGMNGGAAFRASVNQATDAESVKMLIRDFFGGANGG
ncbi:MAG: tRNA dihydrouridine synthase DusB [Acetobacter sp.]|nr:tRNA dihydrouridine synthase DusB [Acetobacter sp.]